MSGDGLSEADGRFLAAVFACSGGQDRPQVSMYDVGRKLGLERSDTSRVAEDLMGLGFIELQTLAGGIRLSERGRELAERLAPAKGREAGLKLGRRPVLDASRQKGLEALVSEIKTQASGLGLDFDSLNELIVDLKTIDMQLTSPRPKTAIVRACFQSIERILQKGSHSRELEKISMLLAE